MRIAIAAAIVLFSAVHVFAQTVTLGASLSVASADDFATRAFQDPWDMNERTDLGWFLHGVDYPLPELTNISFSAGVFSATTGTSPNVFLLETGNPYAARLGKIGTNYPIDASTYRLVAMRMYLSGPSQALFTWNRENLWDGTASQSGAFPVSSGWQTYLVDLPSLGLLGGPTPWSGVIKSLALYPAYSPGGALQLEIDWIRLVNVVPSLCRQVTWTLSGSVDLYLDSDAVTNGNESLLARNVSGNTASAGCSPAGSGYNLYAGALAPGSYYVLARPAGSGSAFTRSSSAYQVNAAPTLSITSPSEEGSDDDFAAAVLGNAWDMDTLADADQYWSMTGQTITTISAETAGGTPLGTTRVLYGTSVAAVPPAVGDPCISLMFFSNRGRTNRIDPNRYRILTVEFGLPNLARSMANGSVARVVWRVAGQTESVSDDISIRSRVGANVMDKLIVDMADRSVLPIEQGSTIGWVPGGSTSPGIDHFRFDLHEFSNPTAFYLKRVKLSSLERVAPGGAYTIRWTASEASGTVTLYYDTDRNPSNGKTLIASTSVSSTNGSYTWTAPNVPAGTQYFIYAEFSDGQNVNAAYAPWPIVIGMTWPTIPRQLRVIR